MANARSIIHARGAFERTNRIIICKGLEYNTLNPMIHPHDQRGITGVYFDPVGLAVAMTEHQIVMVTIPKDIANGKIINLKRGIIHQAFPDYRKMIPKITVCSGVENIHDLHDVLDELCMADEHDVYLKIPDASGALKGVLVSADVMWLCLLGMRAFATSGDVEIKIAPDIYERAGYDHECTYYNGIVSLKTACGVGGIVVSKRFTPPHKGSTKIIISL